MHDPIKHQVEQALSIKYPDGNLPPWTEPFVLAVELLERAEGMQQTREEITAFYIRYAEQHGEELEDSYDPVAAHEKELVEIRTAESKLLSAIDLSGGKESVLFAWLTSVYTKTEDWPLARQAAMKAVELEPYSSAAIFRLSMCYEKEKEYIKAHDYYEKGMTLLPLGERQPHRAKLARLREQADDMKANVFRGDPFNILPLEIIISIMKFGLADRHFVLRCSLVNKTWNRTLVHNCPELWGNLWLVWKELKDKAFNDKREAWIRRSGGNFHTITLDDMTSTGVGKIPNSYRPYFKAIKSLRIATKDNKALCRLFEKFGRRASNLEHLYIDGGRITDSMEHELDPHDALHYSFAAMSSNLTLQSIEVHNVDYRDTGSTYMFGMRFFGRYDPPDAGPDPELPSLRRLTVQACEFDLAETRPVRSPDFAPPTRRHGSCPFYRTLRGSKNNLEYLRVTSESGLVKRSVTQTRSAERIDMVKLKVLILPPPTIWTIDIHARHVESLSFALCEDMLDKYHYERRSNAERLPLIPTIEDSPVNINNLSCLTNLEFEVCSADTIPRLEEWLSRLPNLKRLAIRGSSLMDMDYSGNADSLNCVQTRILETLVAHPEWLPSLSELDLTNCSFPGDTLVKLVRMRKESGTATSLEGLVIVGRRPSDAHLNTLDDEVPRFRHSADPLFG